MLSYDGEEEEEDDEEVRLFVTAASAETFATAVCTVAADDGDGEKHVDVAVIRVAVLLTTTDSTQLLWG